MALIAMCVNCSNSVKQVSEDHSELFGSWYQERTELAKEDMKAIWYWRDVFNLEPNGEYTSITEIKLIDGANIVDGSKILSKGKWQFHGDSVTTFIDRQIVGNDTTFFKEKKNVQTVKIIHVTEDSLVFHDGKMYGVLYKSRDK